MPTKIPKHDDSVYAEMARAIVKEAKEKAHSAPTFHLQWFMYKLSVVSDLKGEGYLFEDSTDPDNKMRFKANKIGAKNAAEMFLENIKHVYDCIRAHSAAFDHGPNHVRNEWYKSETNGYTVHDNHYLYHNHILVTRFDVNESHQKVVNKIADFISNAPTVE